MDRKQHDQFTVHDLFKYWSAQGKYTRSQNALAKRFTAGIAIEQDAGQSVVVEAEEYPLNIEGTWLHNRKRKNDRWPIEFMRMRIASRL